MPVCPAFTMRVRPCGTRLLLCTGHTTYIMNEDEKHRAENANEKRYLIYHKGANGSSGGHALIYFVYAADATQAIVRFLLNESSIVEEENGTLRAYGAVYPHPLAYIEASYKFYGEWQIRELPDWTLHQPVSEIFCGESDDGPPFIIAICRTALRRQFPGRYRARAFVWYLRQGTLVTFFKGGARRMKILKRYLWSWDGHTERVVEYNGDYKQLMNDLLISPVPPKASSV